MVMSLLQMSTVCRILYKRHSYKVVLQLVQYFQKKLSTCMKNANDDDSLIDNEYDDNLMDNGYNDGLIDNRYIYSGNKMSKTLSN